MPATTAGSTLWLLMPSGWRTATATSRARSRNRRRAPAGSARNGTMRTPPGNRSRVRPRPASCASTVQSSTAPASRRPLSSGKSVRAARSATGPTANTRPASIKHQRVRQPVHLRQVVRHIQDRQAREVAQPFQEGQYLGLARPVQCRQRLVHQQQARAGQQGAAERHPLPFAA